MKALRLLLPEPYIEMIDELIQKNFFPNRNEAIRVAVRDLLNEHGAIAKWMHKRKT